MHRAGVKQVAIRLHDEVSALESRGLPARYSSVAQAREFTRDVSRQWQVGSLTEDLVSIVSELVANALDHGLGLGSGPDPGPVERPPIGLCLIRTGTAVACVVSDPTGQPPRRLAPDSGTESGRGVQLVDSLSQRWGWTPTATGKVVWAVVAPAEQTLSADLDDPTGRSSG